MARLELKASLHIAEVLGRTYRAKRVGQAAYLATIQMGAATKLARVLVTRWRERKLGKAIRVTHAQIAAGNTIVRWFRSRRARKAVAMVEAHSARVMAGPTDSGKNPPTPAHM